MFCKAGNSFFSFPTFQGLFPTSQIQTIHHSQKQSQLYFKLLFRLSTKWKIPEVLRIGVHSTSICKLVNHTKPFSTHLAFKKSWSQMKKLILVIFNQRLLIYPILPKAAGNFTTSYSEVHLVVRPDKCNFTDEGKQEKKEEGNKPISWRYTSPRSLDFMWL